MLKKFYATVATSIILGMGLPAHATTDIEGFWGFNQSTGPVIDEVDHRYAVDTTNERPNNGQIGLDDPAGSSGTVERKHSRAKFTGEPNSIILIDEANHEDFNPGALSFRWGVRLKLDDSIEDNEKFPINASWNIVQKGRFGNAGGMWKMQLMNKNGHARIGCTVADQNGEDVTAVNYQVSLRKYKFYDATCILNRFSADPNKHTLRVFVKPRGESERKRYKALPENFGQVSPQAGSCGQTNPFGGRISIGNKPYCPGEIPNKVKPSDQFVGKLYKVKIGVMY